MTETMQFVTVNEVMNSALATLSGKLELALNGGSSPIHVGARFLLLKVRAREHSWSAQFKGNAFALISSDGELGWVGCSALKGGMAYKENPGAGHWVENIDQTYWIWSPIEEDQETLQFGISKLIQRWESDSTPKAPVLVEVQKVQYLWGCSPVEKSKPRPEAGKFSKSVKTWDGVAHFATPEEIEEFRVLSQEKHPENVIPEEWLK